jgi:DNA-binding transcriptional MerR regulator
MEGILECRLRAIDAAGLSGCTYRQLDYWLRTGLLPEPATPADGSGSAREFSFVDVIRVRLVTRLRKEGVSLQAIRKALDILGREWGESDPLASGRLLAIDGAVFYNPTEDELWHVLAGQRAIKQLVTLDVGELARETAEQVLDFCAA